MTIKDWLKLGARRALTIIIGGGWLYIVFAMTDGMTVRTFVIILATLVAFHLRRKLTKTFFKDERMKGCPKFCPHYKE